MTTTGKFFDFDDFMAERTAEPFRVKAFGEVYELPNEIPFEIVLKIARSHKEGKRNMSEEDTVELAHMLFGKKTFNEWLKKGIGLSGVMLMTEKVMGMYMTNAASLSDEMNAKKQGNTP